jgi:hypothetical protein
LDDALAPPPTMCRKPGRVIEDASFFDVFLALQVPWHQVRLPFGRR